MTEQVPFSPPDLTEEDIQAVVDVLRSGWITTGPVAAEFEHALTDFTGAGGVILQNSCTSALEQALRAAKVGPGDDVLLPAYTYSATAAAALHVDANIIFVDNAPGAYVPAPEQYAKAITPETKAVITVDIGGIPYPVDQLSEILEGTGNPTNPFGLGRPVIISDSAHSLGAEIRGLAVGAIADLTAFSFHAVKNLTTAEGGALAWRGGIVPSNENLYRELRWASLHGQSKDALAKSQPGAWEYDILSAAYKTNLPDVLAALGLSQLGRYPESLQRRRQLASQYSKALSEIVRVEPHQGEDYLSSAHLALISLPDDLVDKRDTIIEEMAFRGITCNVHYKPLPMLSAYRELGFDPEAHPNALEVFRRTITLPLFGSMTDEQSYRVAKVFTEVTQ